MKIHHLDGKGEVHMVAVSGKAVTKRTAVATGRVLMKPEALQAILEQSVKKGDVLSVARVAAIQGAKKTADLIPLCHPLALDGVTVDIAALENGTGLTVKVAVETTGRTGAEMEALTAVAAGCLTIYDMGKALDRAMVIDQIQLEAKSGGRSGDFNREALSLDKAPRPETWRVGVITLSDRAFVGVYPDESGPRLAEEVENLLGSAPEKIEVLPDDPEALEEKLLSWADVEKYDLILTTGGTGLSPRDRTPEATQKVVAYEVPGLMEGLRAQSAAITPRALLTRGVAGVRGRTLIINLPGSPKAVTECMTMLTPILEHALITVRGQRDGHG